MEYTVAFCDYDETIFDAASGVVPDRTREAILRYGAAGGRFVLTTGRMYRSIMLQLEKMRFRPDYLICLQGAVGYDFTANTEVFRHGLSCEDWHALARFVEARGWDYHYYHGTDVYTMRDNPFSREYFRYTGVPGVIVGEPLSVWPEATSWDAHKMIVMSPSAETERRVADLRQAFGHLDITCSTPQYIEVVSAAGGKGNALRAMCAYFGVDAAKAVAFGDQGNDISLLKAAGLGVAVGNAVPALKAVADYVAAPCAACGVADVLDAIISDLPLTGDIH